ncbi:unnamed protein product [Pleuronectes platessa]|uniref:Uncharacterized protein n=1 Tax=Pleuronectes platessa TaxID=8262 RepID=A0A9N7VIN1_PLEPL|nr:unnamed protein product [Pleuronectes platessa]
MLTWTAGWKLSSSRSTASFSVQMTDLSSSGIAVKWKKEVPGTGVSHNSTGRNVKQEDVNIKWNIECFFRTATHTPAPGRTTSESRHLMARGKENVKKKVWTPW